MKIIVLNGSPKGDMSVTMQYINYIKKKFPMHELSTINIAQSINKIESDTEKFNSIINEIDKSDGVIWAFPLYIFVVCAQYKRFIELIFERNAQYAFKGKYASIVATSVKLYDNTAINYVNAICDDLEMKFVNYFSPHMDDLHKEDVRNKLEIFADQFFNSIKDCHFTYKNFDPIKYQPIKYISEISHQKINTYNKKITVVADSLDNSNLNGMINKFISCFSKEIEVVALKDIEMKGGCLGCLKCGYNFECAYTGKDQFIEFFNEKIKKSDVIIFAGTIFDRYLSSTWKMFFDRAFFNTHTPVLIDKQIGFIISGPLRQVPNLNQIMDIYSQWQMANLVGFATDEYEASKQIDEQIFSFANNLICCAVTGYRKPNNFLGVGGWKILRDEIWGPIRFPFKADHKAYKALGIYRDFPQKNYKIRFMNLALSVMVKFKKIRNEAYNQVKPSMIKGLKKIVDSTEK